MIQDGKLIAIEGVTKTYRMGEVVVQALRGVSLEVYPGSGDHG